MKEHHADSIRNITLAGHAGSGKTSLSEILLYTAGEVNRIGAISEGNTVSDYNANEIERQFSIQLSLMHLEWNGVKLNLIDAPGYSDFLGDLKSSIRIADTVISVVKAVEGVESGTENAMADVLAAKKAAGVVINKVDSERSDFFAIFEDVKSKLSSNAVIVTFPANQGLNFNTVIDVVKMKAIEYGAPGSKTVSEKDIPADLADKAEEYRTALIEKIAELDEELMNKYFEEGNLSPEEFEKGLKESVRTGNLIPVFALSSAKGIGQTSLLDFSVKYFPSPKDMGDVQGKFKSKDAPVTIPLDDKGEPLMFIFKVISEPHVGELSLFRVFSGSVHHGLDLMNHSNGKSERLSQLYLLNGKSRKEVSHVFAGDIAAVVKLKDTHTNNTLGTKAFDVVLPEIDFPEPLIDGAIIPKAKGDEDKIANCLHMIHEEDPSFNVKWDPEIAQTVVTGQGEFQLALAVKRLKERYGVDVEIMQPRIPYKETIKGTVESIEYKHKKQSGGRGQFGHVVFKMEPLERGKGFEFVDAIVGGVVPGRFIPATEKGVVETMQKGILSGCQVIDVKVTLHFGSYHSVDSDEMSFKIAGSQCFKKGFLEAKPVLLEPIYLITIKVPEEFMGDVMGDASSRRGKIQGMDSDGKNQIIRAMVPLAELYKYSSTLRSLTQGRGIYSRRFSHYEEVPKEVEAKIIEEYKKSREEE